MKATGVTRIRVHDLRHTFAVHFLEDGGHPYDLQQILGHQSSRESERYSHFSTAMSERARRLIDYHPPKPALTGIAGGKRNVLPHKCPTNAEKEAFSAATDLASF